MRAAASRALTLAHALVLAACGGERAGMNFPLCAHCLDVDGVVALGEAPAVQVFLFYGGNCAEVTSSRPDVLEVTMSETCVVTLRGVSVGRSLLVLRVSGETAATYTIDVATPARGTLVAMMDRHARMDPEALDVALGRQFDRRVLLWDALDRILMTSAEAAWSIDGTAVSRLPEGHFLAAEIGDVTLHGTLAGLDVTLPVHVLSVADFAASPDCEPQSEVCNGLDEDCDGQIDENPEVGPICDLGDGDPSVCLGGECAVGLCGMPWVAACSTGGVANPSWCFYDLRTNTPTCGGCERNCDAELGHGARCVDRVCVR